MEFNIIYNEDCLIGMNKIHDHSIDMILCDLPYGTSKCKWDTIINFEVLWKHYYRILKPNGVIALFGNEPFSSYLRLSNVKNYKYDWVWNKVTARGHLVAKKRPLQQTENIMIFYKPPIVYYPQMIERPFNKIEMGKEYKRTDLIGGKSNDHYKKYTHYYPKNLLTYSNASRTNLHPAQKSLSLSEYLIKTYTKEKEIILDNCMGSGTTAIACINIDRRYIGFELDKKYYDICMGTIKTWKGPELIK